MFVSDYCSTVGAKLFWDSYRFTSENEKNNIKRQELTGHSLSLSPFKYAERKYHGSKIARRSWVGRARNITSTGENFDFPPCLKARNRSVEC